jgi:hypothetical protein
MGRKSQCGALVRSARLGPTFRCLKARRLVDRIHWGIMLYVNYILEGQSKAYAWLWRNMSS